MPLLPRPLDFNQTAFRLVRAATGEPVEDAPEGPNPAAVQLGSRGGKAGGKARAAKLSKAKRKAIARKAANTRWGKEDTGEP